MKGVLVVMVAWLSSVLGCSFPPGQSPPKPMSLEEKLQLAPVVVYARYTSLEDFQPPRGADIKNAHLLLHCIFKSDHTITGDEIQILQYRPKHSCSGTSIEIGKDYVFTLQRSTRLDNNTGFYGLFEGVALGSAAYEFNGTSDLLTRVANVCGLDAFTPPTTGCRADDSCCPGIPDLDPGECVRDGGDGAGRGAAVQSVINNVNIVVCLGVSLFCLFSRRHVTSLLN